MAIVSVSQISDVALDWAVGQSDPRCAGLRWEVRRGVMFGVCQGEGIDGVAACFVSNFDPLKRAKLERMTETKWYSPSRQWVQAGLIIDETMIDIDYQPARIPERICRAITDRKTPGVRAIAFGPDALVASMRAYVIAHLGDEIEIPDVLLNN